MNESQVDELGDLGALSERLETNDRLRAAVTRADDNFAGFRAVVAELARVGAGNPSAVPELRARMGFHADELASAVAEAKKTALRLAGAPEVDSQRVETLLASSATTLAATFKLVDGLSELNEADLEARRLATIIAERLQGMRRAVAQFERYFKTVYGGKK
jgi:hypothetical protein